MGLDMYLKVELYVGGSFEHRAVKGTVELTAGMEKSRLMKLEPKEIESITLRVGYWRKANAIHGWFVRECQGGVDGCQRTEVEMEKLVELKQLCERAIKEKDANLLPPTEGFFFGGTEIDEWYWDGLRDTVKIVGGAEAMVERFKGWSPTFVYHSSW